MPKRILKILLIVVMLFTFVGCENESSETKLEEEEMKNLDAWPTDVFFSTITPLVDKAYIDLEENDRGLKYVISINEIDYNILRSWILNLENQGFKNNYTKYMFPLKKEKILKETISWSSEKLINGIYLGVVYDDKKSYENDYQVIITILNYDPLK